MKKLSVLTAGILMVFSLAIVTFYTSCTDPCKDVTCLNAGTCVDGTCDCADGYEGTDCGTETRAQFLGSYSVASGTITCGVTGNSTISAGTSVNVTTNSGGVKKIAISLGGVLTVVATVSGSTLTIDNQTISGFTYSGTGSVSSNTLTVALNEDDPSIPETCVYNFTATK